jgi:hypothetical protein
MGGAELKLLLERTLKSYDLMASFPGRENRINSRIQYCFPVTENTKLAVLAVRSRALVERRAPVQLDFLEVHDAVYAAQRHSHRRIAWARLREQRPERLQREGKQGGERARPANCPLHHHLAR